MKLTTAFFLVFLVCAEAIFTSPFNRAHESFKSRNEKTASTNAEVLIEAEPTPAPAPVAAEGEKFWDREIPSGDEEVFDGFGEMADDFMPLKQEEIIDVGRIPDETLIDQEEIIDVSQIPGTKLQSGTSIDIDDFPRLGIDLTASNELPRPFAHLNPNRAVFDESQDWKTVQKFIEAHSGFHNSFLGLGQF